jgi:predicted metal-dependent RNase
MKPMTPHLKKVFLVHGEGAQASALAASIHSTYGIETVVARSGQRFDLV